MDYTLIVGYLTNPLTADANGKSILKHKDMSIFCSTSLISAKVYFHPMLVRESILCPSVTVTVEVKPVRCLRKHKCGRLHGLLYGSWDG